MYRAIFKHLIDIRNCNSYCETPKQIHNLPPAASIIKSLTSLLIITTSTIATTVAGSSSKHFHLKSSNTTNREHNNLYIYACHTSSGVSNTALTNDMNTASSVFLNDTNALFDFNTTFPWGFAATNNTKHSFCNWNHNTPQLFYLSRYYDATIPSSYSKVQLNADHIKFIR
ncbi:unnamed protein product [Penicillium salamii]|nr:unnamed protein product [Penicillium salamii]CAG8208604.1 unnamed protein product [Penicillium salamii]CAG8413250.1 unnamed protein product [Penicillium salamii]